MRYITPSAYFWENKAEEAVEQGDKAKALDLYLKAVNTTVSRKRAEIYLNKMRSLCE